MIDRASVTDPNPNPVEYTEAPPSLPSSNRPCARGYVRQEVPMPCPECGQYYLPPSGVERWAPKLRKPRHSGRWIVAFIALVAIVLFFAMQPVALVVLLCTPTVFVVPVIYAIASGLFFQSRCPAASAWMWLSSFLILLSAFVWAPALVPATESGLLIAALDPRFFIRAMAILAILLLNTIVFFGYCVLRSRL